MRMNRCNEILKEAISLKQSLEKFIGDTTRLTDKLLELCNKPVRSQKSQMVQYLKGCFRSHYKKMFHVQLCKQILTCVCVAQVDGNSTTLSMSIHFKQLKRLVEEPTFSQILIPLQSVLIPTLPSTGGANTKHDAFPGHWAYLDSFEDTVRKTHGCHLVNNVMHN